MRQIPCENWPAKWSDPSIRSVYQTAPPATFSPSRHRAAGNRLPGGRSAMPRCDTCGNEYDKAFQVVMNGRTHTFDSFECAIHKLAPTCKHCGCRIIGHRLEA